MKEKTFYKILVEFTSSIEKTKRSISDMRLTKTEKLIIEGHLNIRKNMNQEVLDMFCDIPPSELSFVESQRHLLIGSAFNNLSKFVEAEKHLQKSVEIIQRTEDSFFLFNALHTLFVIYDNLNENAFMLRTIESMRNVKKSKRQAAQFLICEFCYEKKVEHYQRAKILYKEIDLLTSDLTEGDITRHLMHKFMFFVQLEDLEPAKDVLALLKQCRNYQMSENYNFMKKMLAHLTEDAPLYVYDHQFSNVPLLLHQLKVIQYLEEKNIDAAKKHWEALGQISPNTYGENFQYMASTCLFSLALAKHKHFVKGVIELMPPEGESKLDQLVSFLQSCPTPVSSSLLYEVIWGRPAETKEDLKKVSRLMSRAKAEKDISIEYRKGTYFISKTKQSKAS